MAEEIPGVWHNCPMSNEPVTDVDPVADSPRSRVEMFKSSTFYPESVDRQEGRATSSSSTTHFNAFSVNEEGKPTESAVVAVENPVTHTLWQPHHLDGPKLITNEDVKNGFVETPDGGKRQITSYEHSLRRDPKVQEDGTAPLFYVHQQDAKIDHMYRSKGGINLAGSYLLGAISKQFSGINKPSYSNSLSPWSASLVKKADKLGLIKENPDLPLSYVDKIAKGPLSEKQDFPDTMTRSLERDYRSLKDYKEAAQIPQKEVEEFPKVIRGAIADAKSQQFSEAFKPPQEEDNTRDVPLPGFEEK